MSDIQAPAKDTDRYFGSILEEETWTIEDASTITEADIIISPASQGTYTAVSSKP